MSKLSFGIGYNSGGKNKTKVSGKRTTAYQTWYNMIQRCYCPNYHFRQPSYIGCTVDVRWHDFQNFADWYVGHNYCKLGYQLDKDILFAGNKSYSPETCCLIPAELNTLVSDRRSTKGKHPEGVYFDKNSNKFKAQLRTGGKRKHLGLFDCQHDAYLSYVSAKEAHVRKKAIDWRGCIDRRAFDALVNWRVL